MLLAALLLLAADPRPFLDRHCFGCHDATSRKGGLDLTKLPPGDAKWVRVHDRLAAGEMPPSKKPPKADVDAALKQLSTTLINAETTRRAKDGRSTVRRLNRTEYENTLRDLLDLPGLSVKDMLPDDGRAHGYDRSADALDVSPLLIAKYAEAAEFALDQATAKYSVPPEVYRAKLYPTDQHDLCNVIGNGDGVIVKDFKYDPRFPIPTTKQYEGKYKGLGEALKAGIYKEPGSVGLFRNQDESFQCRFRFAPIHPGRYRIALSVWSFWWDKGTISAAPRRGAAGLYVGARLLGHFDAPSLKPTHHEITPWLNPDGYMKFNTASIWNVRVNERKGLAGMYTGPAVAVDWISVEGPIHDEWPPPSHKRLFGDLPVVAFNKLPKDAPRPERVMPKQLPGDAQNFPGKLTFGTVQSKAQAADAERLLSVFLPRAFRRPVTKAEVARYAEIAVKRVADGACFEDAMKSAYRTALCAPDFLFLHQPVGALDGPALASRLSYFLWSSMPDDALTAVRDRLSNPETLRTQVERLLKDPKAERFMGDFIDQWLDVREFDLTSPDRALYPEYQPYLADAMRQEPMEFFRSLLTANHPAAQAVRGGFVSVNQRLAEHYGIKGVEGTRFRNVGVPVGVHRGGFLTQAAILKVTANGTTTSPVKRGAWVLRKILGKPPQPPPPDIAAVEPDVRGATTIREQLAKHRDNPSCSSCHRTMDPPGFALESFDVIGGLRSRYRSIGKGDTADFAKAFPSHLNPAGKFSTAYYHVGFRDGPKVDATGETADGKPFAGIDDMKRLLASDERGLARNLANQLITYATGAPVGFADRAEVERILDRAGPGFRVRSLVHEIIRSPLFLNK